MDFQRKRLHLAFQLLPLFFLMIAIIIGTLNIKTIIQLFIGASGEDANIVVDTQSNLGPLPRPWHSLAQGGENKNWRLAPLSAQVKALNPDTIRIDHLYDFYDIVKDEGGRLSFDFSKLDPVIADITAVGAKPYIALSYTPPALSVNGDITAPPRSWAQWQLTVQKTIEHISGTLGISGVYYEVWNEPDLFGGYKTYGGRNYLDLYRSSAKGALSARNVRPFKFGGPAITALYKGWVDGLLTMTQKENLPLDFFSWHRYTTDIDQYRRDIAQVREWLSPYPGSDRIELHITEWGHNSNVDPGYDGSFGAIHTIAVSTELSGNIDKAFVFEIQDGADPAGKEFWGRWGLFSVNGKAKPRYNALRFLDRLGDTKLQLTGRGTWVKAIAAKDGADTTLILANYDPSGRHSEVTPVTFTNIVPGNYEIEQQPFQSVANKQRIATDSATLQISVPMGTNTATFIRLKQLIP